MEEKLEGFNFLMVIYVAIMGLGKWQFIGKYFPFWQVKPYSTMEMEKKFQCEKILLLE